eukprot:TRINITY_DN51754_c0_g1_i1.p1 TRINITY_DN51754_c0_g1~~TRINITY_DN51754_c0_g1_i1.p1  ORF type:complete len:419 (+),score=53.76 TRINITY_DN51754_c0_g1_i1:63-1259(+)
MVSSTIRSLALLSSLGLNFAEELYALDATWKPQFPIGAHMFSAVGVANMEGFPWDPPPGSLVFVTQRGNASLPPVLVMNGTDGTLVDSWGEKTVGLDYSTPSEPTWGAHGLAVENCNYPCEASEGWYSFMRVYIDDFTNHTLTMYTGKGKQLLQMGTNGVAGKLAHLQFDHIADSVVQTGYVAPAPAPVPGHPAPLVFGPSYVYSSDGDGGHANRVVKVALNGHRPSVEWSTGHLYHNPHSIAFHQQSHLLVVADRDNNNTRLIRSATGEDLGAWNCGVDYGKRGKPFGVRTLNFVDECSQQYVTLLAVAIMDNPQDGQNQKILLLDASKLNDADGVKSRCNVVQELDIGTAYSGPHLLGVDAHSGDIYSTLVSDSPKSTVLRFKRKGCMQAHEPIQV